MHIGRTHRVNLDWIIERFRDDPSIAVRFVSRKSQIADILTKAQFTSDQWNHLCRLSQVGPPSTEKLDSTEISNGNLSQSAITSQSIGDKHLSHSVLIAAHSCSSTSSFCPVGRKSCLSHSSLVKMPNPLPSSSSGKAGAAKGDVWEDYSGLQKDAPLPSTY